MPEIETARLLLRPFNLNDLDDLARLFGDPAVMRYLGVEGGKTLTRAETQAALDAFIAGWHERGFGRWAVLRKATQQWLGLCGLRLLDGAPELVYALTKDNWRQGFATEAAQACLRFAFEELQLERIVAVTRPGNVASQRVLEKIGMRYEREVQYYGVDALGYALTQAEFRASDAFYLLHRD
jgi:ribosomal-protein-alanine N-acetyltransferase